ncbi:histidine phosphatase family protein [Nocardioides sp. GY 10127]|uniref:histidine phosphatase family protein n=1 Tax=Nocardioides sp. GY 10127 TaxID=2569762 RepID=UPI0010A783D3|nr:histidine phosphatase family protein [Nocardioides sp. GY 10127]TIC84012.1 histidine phosphatase family protein [Nocardioides sp. GY 10127]
MADVVDAPGGRRLLLLRHGRTPYNHARVVQGHIDSSLDDTGLHQAAAVAPRIAALDPQHVWCSDLTRARQTAEPLLAATGLEATYDARLREFNLGTREGLSHPEYEAAAPEEYATFVTGDFDVVDGGEATAAVAQRMTSALDELLAATDPGRVSVAVSHGAAIRVAAVAMLGWPLEVSRSLRGLANCGWVELVEYHDTARGLRLAAYNRVVGPDVAPVAPATV